MIAAALRSIRTLGFRLASPLDRAWLLATGRGHLPSALASPAHGLRVRLRERRAGDLRLSGSVGPVERRPGRARRGLRSGGDGRGVPRAARPGRALRGLRRARAFDPLVPQAHWASDPRLSFEVAPVASAYGSASGRPIESYRFPVGDGEADLVLAKSVFTHLTADGARHYLAETRRVLRPGRPPSSRRFSTSEPDPRAWRWRSPTRPGTACAEVARAPDRGRRLGEVAFRSP